MIYLSMLLSFPLLYFAPWWTLALYGALLAMFFGRRVKIAVGAGLSGAIVALIRDGQSHGLISKRVAGLFGLPQSFWLFIVMAALVFLTTLAGTALIPNWSAPKAKT